MHGGEGHPEDELIVVPKGQKRLQFYFKFGLLVFLLVIFVVPGALMSSLTKGSELADKTYLSWTGSDGETHSYSSSEFVQRKRDLLTLDETAPAFTRMRGIGNLALLGLGDFDPKEELDTARFLLLVDLAKKEGIRTTPKSLAEWIQNLFGGAENYRAELDQRRAYLTPSEFEDSLSKALMVRTFLGYVAAAAATADPAEVVRRWQAGNQEYAFDYVEVPTENFAEAARAALPSDEELNAWLDALTGPRKTAYNAPLRWKAQFAYVPLGEGAQANWPYEALLAKYPRPADEKPEELAQRYYDGQKFTRFNRPEPLADTEDPQLRLYLPFEEVREQAMREAPVYFALQDWHADMGKRAAEEGAAPIDFAAEAQELGLSFAAPEEARSAAEWLDAEYPWGAKDARLAGRMGSVREANQLVPSVSVTNDAMVVARVTDRVEPALPPFAEIRDKVADDWAKEKQTELAKAALEEVRDQLGDRPEPPEDGSEPAETFEPKPTAELFAQSVESKGFEVQRRDYAGRKSPHIAAEGEAAVEEFLSFQPFYYSLEENAVPEPRANRTNTKVYLVRYAGRRDPDLSKLQPSDLDKLRRQIEQESVADFIQRTFGSREYLEQTFHLELHDQRTKPGKPEKPQAPAPAPG